MLDLAADTNVTAMRMLTPDYASPEQVGGGQSPPATDIYSLGAVLYRSLPAGRRIGRRTARFCATPDGIATREIPGPQVGTGAEGRSRIILLKALRTEPQDRYATVEQFAEDLERISNRDRSGHAR